LVVRKGQVRHLLPEGGFGGPSHISYYEVCANVRVVELAEALVRAAGVFGRRRPTRPRLVKLGRRNAKTGN